MFERFETCEFVIRKIEMSDVDSIFRNWAQEIDVARYTTWRIHSSKDETERYVESCIEGWGRENYTWTIEDKASSKVVGSFAARENGHKIDIGYLLAVNWWGKGVMTSIVTSFINDAFKIDTIQRIGAVCDIENPASRRVMEKSGMIHEGILSSWMVHPNMGQNARDCHCLGTTRQRHNKSLQQKT